MRYVRLGRSGLEISAIGLGCLGFGEPARGGYPWSLPYDDSLPLIRAAVDAGITFFDTANAYSAGTSESFLGRALREIGVDRDEVVVATKLWAPMGRGPNRKGLSHKEIRAELDASLRRLQVDHVDLYQVHRWDERTPVDETLTALDDAVRAGKVRYLGASSMWSWQLTALGSAVVSMQDQYSLLAREVEREVLPLCLSAGIGVLPWSPLARGLLARPWGSEAVRLESDEYASRAYPPSDAEVVAAVADVARERGSSMAAVALAWVSRHPAVSAPIVGVTRERHLADAVSSLDVDLTDDEVARLEAAYVPRPVLFG